MYNYFTNIFMLKLNCIYSKKNIKSKSRRHLSLARVLLKNPIKKTIVQKITITTPRKPNSARRKTVKSTYKLSKKILSYIPGGSHSLKKFSNILVRGRGARDLPGIYTTGIRGSLDLYGILLKTRRRSIYGTKKTLIMFKKFFFSKSSFKLPNQFNSKLVWLNNVYSCITDLNKTLYIYNGISFVKKKIIFIHINSPTKNLIMTKKFKNKI